MEALFEIAQEHILPHWPFFAWFVIAMLIGQVTKNTLWTKRNAIEKKPLWFWWWARKTMVLHPVAAGIVVGLIWRDPEGGDSWPAIASCAYFALSGALSTWGYEALKNLAKKKADIELTLPGLSEPPDDDA